MCNLYSITTNQAAIIALFRVMNHNVGNLPPMPGVFPDYPAPVVRNTGADRELVMMRWGMPPPLRTGGPPCHQYPQHHLAALARLVKAREPLSGPGQ
jgi:putative SOS response-associated peptidase YedK